MSVKLGALQTIRSLADEFPSVIRDQVGPSTSEIRPYSAPTSSTFPVIDNLLGKMLQSPNPKDPAVPEIARALATCAGYAYSDVGTVATMMTRMGLERSRCRQITRSVDAMFIQSTAHLIQSEDGRVVILCYRGTPPLDLISWLLDADVAPEQVRLEANSQSFEVHSGFYRNVRMTRSEVVAALLRALNGLPVDGDRGSDDTGDPTFRRIESTDLSESLEATQEMKPMEALYITGHSLGGAMAVIMARMLLMANHPEYSKIAKKLKAVYTFGQPMVATPSSAEESESLFQKAKVPLCRYVYRKDPVPALPPWDAGPYGHFGQEYRLAEAGGYEAKVQSTEQMKLSAELIESGVPFLLNKIPFVKKHLRWPYDIDDHFPNNYISSLIPNGGADEFGDYVVTPI